jgi:Cu/Ag efflux pump CusA
MFSWIVGTSLKFRFLLVAISAALLVFGSDRIREMPIDVFPEFAPPKVEIQTIGLGMTAAEVEEFITPASPTSSSSSRWARISSRRGSG